MGNCWRMFFFEFAKKIKMGRRDRELLELLLLGQNSYVTLSCLLGPVLLRASRVQVLSPVTCHVVVFLFFSFIFLLIFLGRGYCTHVRALALEHAHFKY
jgi:hypothetical protein